MKTSVLLRSLLAFVLVMVAFQPSDGQTTARHLSAVGSPVLSMDVTGLPLPAGTYTVGTGGYFPTLDSAFSRLRGGGIAGAVTLSLTDTLYVPLPSSNGRFTLQGPISGAGPSSRITLRPADGKSVSIQGNGESAILFRNVSYLTFDGIGLTGSTRLEVHALSNVVGPRWNDAVDFIGNDDFDIVRNISVRSDDLRSPTGVMFWADSLGAPDSCLATGILVRTVAFGIYVAGWGTNYNPRPSGNVIRGNQIGSPADSNIAWGIQDEGSDGTLIENNHVQHLRRSQDGGGGEMFLIGINSYYGRNALIRNNFVHDLSPTTIGTNREGILASGDYSLRGNSVWIYNNMVYDIKTGTGAEMTSELAGIRAWNQDHLLVDNNSVHLTGYPEGSGLVVSAAAWTDGTVASPTFRNNIFVNTRNDPGCAALRIDGSPWGSNNNDLYVVPSGNGVIGRWSTLFYKTLGDWQTKGSDLNSVSLFPTFCDLPCLHVDSTKSSSESLDGHGMMIPGITYDFDGQVRNFVTPDIGADEFTLKTGYPGQCWQRQQSNYPPDVGGIGFSVVNREVCWGLGYKLDGVSAYPGYIRTTNGGTTWLCDSIPGAENGVFSSMVSIDADTAYVAVFVNDPSTSKGIYKTTDGGRTWTKQNVFISSLYGPGYIHFFDANNGFAVGDPNLEAYATTNGGSTWTPVGISAYVNEYTWVGGPCMVGVGNRLWFGTGARFFRSTDRGYTWSVNPVENDHFDWHPYIAFQDSMTGICALRKSGNVSHLYRKTTDGGVTWAPLSNPVLDNLAPTSIVYVPGTKGTYVVAGGMPQGMRGLARTYDAGSTWKLLDSGGVFNIGFACADVGWGDDFSSNIVSKFAGTPLGISVRAGLPVPTACILAQNYPNPFNPVTTIEFAFPKASLVNLTVYDILGRQVAVLVNERRDAGTHVVTFNGANLASGVYFYRLRAGDFVSTKKFVLQK